jgi:hypothetical protein
MTERKRPLNYDGIKALAASLDRPARSLIALDGCNDPFYLTPARQANAEWFAELWERLGAGAGMHVRRFHYLVISQDEPIAMVNGDPYENTVNCWVYLGQASRDARYLKLVPAEHFVDRKNNEPIIHVENVEASAAQIASFNDEPCAGDNAVPSIHFESTDMPSLPFLQLSPPTIPQPYHVEIWCEKTAVNNVLEPLAQRYGCNLVTGTGELSAIACNDVVERARTSGRPVRILYISDFDPAGQSMPVAVARKIEFVLRTEGLDLDVQVRQIVLTHDQCIRYRLPRTPIKETERRGARFESRFGEGATELDALEALHPGELRKIVKGEIERYHDANLDRRIQAKASKVNKEIADIESEIEDEHRDELDALESQWATIVAECESLEAEMEEQREDLQVKIEAWKERANPTWHAMSESLQARAPDLDAIEWPEPDEGDEDPDPLFDSIRDYIEQIDRYKEHQGRPTERRAYASRPERLKRKGRHVADGGHPRRGKKSRRKRDSKGQFNKSPEEAE